MKIDRGIKLGILTGLALLAATASPSRAEIIAVSGQVTQIATPTNDVPGSPGYNLQSDTTAFIWSEKTGYVLTSDVSVNMTKSGMSDSTNSFNPSPGTILSGTDVDTYMIHSDPVGSTSETYVGSVTFNTKILGIIDLTAGLNSTDSTLGSPTTAYPSNQTDRGLEGTDSLGITITDNGTTINFTTGAFEDEVRVITAAVVPEPASIISCATGAAALLGFGWFRRRRARILAAA